MTWLAYLLWIPVIIGGMVGAYYMWRGCNGE